MKGLVFFMKNKLLGIFKNEEGQGMTEYGLIIAFVAVIALVGIKLLGVNLNTLFSGIAFK